jgi:tetratricopeptide (TPR) repeat protein/CHAT domain-containing protein
MSREHLQSIDELLNLGNQQALFGNYKAALGFYEQAISFNVHSLDAWRGKALALKQLGNLEEAKFSHHVVISLCISEADKKLKVSLYEEALNYLSIAQELDPKDCQVLVKKGHILFKKERYGEAVECLNSALNANPNDLAILYCRASALFALEYYKEALYDYDLIVRLDPKPGASVWFVYGCLLKSQNRYSEAIDSFDRALRLNQDDDVSWRERGISLRALGRFEEALYSCNRAIQCNDKSYENLHQRGLSLLKLNRYSEALDDLNQVLDFKPDHCEAFADRGIILFMQGKYEESLVSVEQALIIDCNYCYAWNQKAVIFGLLGNYGEALECCEQALAIHPGYELALLNRIYILDSLGQYSDAIAACDEVLKVTCDRFYPLMAKADLLGKLQLYEEAIRNYSEIFQLKPISSSGCVENFFVFTSLIKFNESVLTFFDSASNLEASCEAFARYRLGRLLTQICNYEAAIDNYNCALSLNPSLYPVLGDLGILLSKVDSFQDALNSYNQALKLWSDNYEILNNRAGLHCSMSMYKEALDDVNQSISIKPDYSTAWHSKGVILCKLKQWEEAIKCLAQSLKIEPFSWEAWLAMGHAVGHASEGQDSIYLPDSIHIFDLSKRGFEGSLTTYKKGLEYIHQDTHPEGWGMLYRAIGNIYHQHGCHSLQNTHYLWTAIENYQLALTSLNQFPESQLSVIQDLVNAYLAIEEISLAKNAQVQGVQILIDLLDSSPSRARKRQLELKFSGFRRMSVDVLVQSGELNLALREAERDKNRSLNWILEEWQEPQWSPTVEQMREMLDETTAIVYWHLSDDALTTFVLRVDTSEPMVVASTAASGLQQRDFENWLKDWNRDYEDYRTKGKQPEENRQAHPWRVRLAERLEQLKEILQIEAITPHLTTITHLILVPHRDLHRFPLHALFGDRFTVTYLPSLQVGLNLQERYGRGRLRVQRGDYPFGELRSKRLLSIENPPHEGTPELLYAELESAIISSLFQQPTRLVREAVTEEALQATLLTPHQLLHFTGHGEFNSRQPQLSALGLAGKERLTAEAIAQLPLEHYQLVCLASCETATVGLQMIETEYVGLVSAFLRAKAAYVVSTLWSVDEISSTYLMVRFYQLCLEGHAPAQALQQAQTWLRTASYADLADWIKELILQEKLTNTIQTELESQLRGLRQRESLEDIPYNDYYHWAAFTLSGRVTP